MSKHQLTKKVLRFQHLVSRLCRGRTSLLAALLVLAVLLPAAYFLTLKPHSASAWWNDNWMYRKSIGITNSSGGDLTDFQVEVLSNFDMSSDVTAGKVQDDFDDLRFTDVNGKLLDYWIEDNTSSSLNVWVKVPSITTSGATVYVYYGNPSADSYQNGNDVFEFFDDFSTDTIDTSKWTEKHYDNTGSVSIVNDWVRINSSDDGDFWSTADGGSGIFANTPLSDNYTITTKFREESLGADSDYSRFLMTRADVSVNNSAFYGLLFDGDASHITTVWRDSLSGTADWAGINTGWNRGSNTTFFTKITKAGDNYYTHASADGNSWSASGNGSGPYHGYLGLVDSYHNGYAEFDWVYVRKYAATEPTAETPDSEEESEGPVAYWSFDEGYGTTAHDSTQNGNDGTFGTGSSAPTWASEDMCISGKCLKFDGTDDYVSKSDFNASQINTGTITVWFKANSTQVTNARIVETGVAADRVGLFIDSNKKLGLYLVKSSGAIVDIASTSTVNDNNWHHAVGYWNDNGAWLYLDGNLSASTTGDKTLNLGSSVTLYAGEYVGGGNYYFSGFIDEVKIYPYARSAEQIKTDFNAGLASGGSAVLGSSTIGDTLSNGLVGYWKMDENTGTTLSDSSGVGNTGAFGAGNSAPGWTSGMYGTGLSFDGSTDYANIGDPVSGILDFGTGDFTLSAWINLTSSVSQIQTILGKKISGSTAIGYAMWVNTYSTNNHKIHVGISDGITGGEVVSTEDNVITNNTWTLVTTIRKNGLVKIYVNGVEKGEGTLSEDVSSTQLFNIGRHSNGNFPFTGTLDEVRVYNRALSPTEVRQLYNWAPGPVAHYTFEEGSGETVQDRSGNSNTGTLGSDSAAPTWSTGKYGKGLKFDGSNDYVDANSDSKIDNLNLMTVSLWVNPSSYSHQLVNYPVAKYSGWAFGIMGNYSICGAGGDGKIYVYNGTTQVCSNTAVPINQWSHISFTYSNSTITLYINGTNVGSGALTLADDSASDLNIGRRSDSSWYYRGFIDDIRIYNYARTQKQIISDMNAGHPAVGSPVGSPVAYWKMDEGFSSTINNSGNGGIGLSGVFGTGSSAPTWSNDGKFSKALQFDGSNDYIQGANTGLSAIQGTISAWVNPNTTTGTGQYIVMGSMEPNRIYLMRAATTGNLRAILGNTTTVDTNQNIPENIWSQVGMTWDNGNYALYHNGIKIASGTYTSFSSLGACLSIGSYSSCSVRNSFFPGLIDEVKIYNYALTEDEVKLDYNRGSAMVLGSYSNNTGSTAPSGSSSQTYCIPGDSSTCRPPVVELKMDEKTGTTTYDTSGNGNNGSIGASTWKSLGTCKNGSCLYFDGNDQVSISSGPSLSTNATIEGWFYWQSGTASLIRDNTCSGGWILAYNNGGSITYRLGGSSFNSGIAVAPLQNTWTHYAMTKNDGVVKYYINGKLSHSGSGAGSTANALPWHIMANGSCGAYLTGYADRVLMYDYARTPAQIAWDYNRGGPVGWWKLDECQGTTAYDSSGIGNTGMITIGSSGSQTTVGSCGVGNTAAAWYNGASGKYGASLNFDGTDDYVGIGNTLNYIKTLSFWAKPSSTSQQIIELSASDSVEISSGTVVATGFGTETIYVDGKQTTGFPDTNWHLVTIISSSDITANTIGLGKVGVNYFSGQIDDVRIYNYALTAEQVKNLYNAGSAVHFGN